MIINVTKLKKQLNDEIDPSIKLFLNIEDKKQVAFVIEFHLKEKDKLKKFIELCGSYCTFDKIESEKTREECLKHAQWLIDRGNYTYYHDEENGTPFDELPSEEQEKVGLGYWESKRSKWSKWTPEKILEQNGWEEDEIYWLSLAKDNTYTYQLILKEGDFVYFAPLRPEYKFGNTIKIDGKIALPYMSDWVEVS